MIKANTIVSYFIHCSIILNLIVSGGHVLKMQISLAMAAAEASSPSASTVDGAKD